MRKLFLLFWALIATTTLSAHDFEVDGIYYNYLDGNNVAVTYKGSYSYSYEDEYSGEVNIPETVTYDGTTYSVTSIGDDAFYWCESLTSITIPNSVTSIGNSAFYYCRSLTSITIPNSVTSIGDDAFYWCESLTSIEIPNSVTSIGNSAFYYCRSLTSITIPNSVTSIGNLAFLGCSGLTSIVVEEGNTVYDSRENCNALIETASNTLVVGCQNTTIPNSVTSIGSGAFRDCDGLTSITIPNSVTNIGNSAFWGCSGLKSVTIPNSVTSIGSDAFRDCDGLISVVWNAENYADFSSSSYALFYNLRSQITSFTFGDSVKHIPAYICYGMSKLKSITIPNSVTSIGESTFSSCSGLTSIVVEEGNTVYDSRENCNALIETASNTLVVGCQNTTIPNSVTSIGEWAFYSCSGLTSVTIGNNVTSIGNSAFWGCSGLKSVTIPNSVTSIGSGAFRDCDGLISVVWNAENYADFSSSSYALFYDLRSQITSFTFGDSVKHIPAYICYGMSKLKSITIPNSVTSIGESTFSSCSGLRSVVWNAENCGDFLYSTPPFYDLSSQITSFTFGEDVKHIPAYLCRDMYNLTSITIPNSVTSIGNNAFGGCSGLTSVTIGNSVTSIGNNAFGGCSGLRSVVWNAENCGDFSYSTPPFYDLSSQITSFTFGEDVKHIPAYLCRDMYNLTSITIPNSVTSIGSGAFRGCDGLTSITIPNSVTSIGNNAFGGCSGLTSVTIPNSVTSIGNLAFLGCSGLKSVTIGNSVTSIGDYAFMDCSGLTSVVWNAENCADSLYSPFYDIRSQITSFIFGEDVKHITANLCEGMSKFTSITIPNSVTSIGSGAFDDCSGLTSVTIGNSVTSIGNWAFYECSGLTSINVFAEVPPTLGTNAFYNVSTAIPVYVPCGSAYAYQSAEGWNKFTTIQELLVIYSIEVGVNDSIMGTSRVDYNTCSEGAQITATPNCGYHFTQWSDGNIDNPRSLVLTQDTTFTAEFVQSFSGKCGDNLYWAYDENNKTISITGSGDMYDYTKATQPWLLFQEQITEVTTSNTTTSIGTSAFEGCVRLSKVSLAYGMGNIAANAFAECKRLYDIYVYATYPPFAEESSFANYNVYVYIPCEYQRDYILDVIWGNFKYIECLSSDKVDTDADTVVVAPSTNDVTITWPTDPNADTYVIVIKQGDKVFCNLTFNKDGMLLNIAFAPSRTGNHPTTYATQTAGGLRFTITSLEEGTTYAYNITTKDEEENTISTYTGEFTTQRNIATDLENSYSPSQAVDCQKLLRNGQLIIIRDGVEYNVMGQQL